MKFFQSVKNFFSKVVGFCIITTAALVCSSDLGLNGFLSFLLWIGFMIILIKGSAVLSSVISVIAVFGIYLLKNGLDDKAEKYVMGFVGLGVLFFCMMNFGKIFDSFAGGLKGNYKGDIGTRSGFKTDNNSDYDDYDDYYDDIDIVPKWKIESDSNGLKNGSDEYWEIKNQAESIYYEIADSTGHEREINIKCANKLAYRLREKYGFDDPVVNDIIKKYYLDWKS